ncbi:helix-turn-helix transcriptional regulator [Pseudonocardia sp. WMMC193]|uniref:helix-turn-helix domain-containing protein n=1 Tax=Pseudonocardia sp. WMMC193 TaxID=2911965 RepID=UPI001F3AC063|nr:helix-turn-helix transcriptional regulator [Pseudonocardia sp. WMMC193]MCF7547284.1 helix-turn-helix transcriptional regulator [Pseudonocardia sp. WMMC193]MCF7547379.1 helix-turn-helix transcriptional regulator [Pseudonocardia sp. WMMC193]
MSGLLVREKLGAGLRGVRKAAGLTGAELAAALDISQTSVSRLEAGKRSADSELIERWLTATEAPSDVAAELRRLAGQNSELSTWRDLHSRGWKAHQRDYADLERSARQVLTFQNALIPGLLQTAAYTSYLLETVVGLDRDALGDAVRTRIERQRLLYQRDTHLRVIVTEAVLRQRLGSSAIMAEQLRRLADLSRLPTVELGVIPLDTDMPSRFGVSFDLFERLDGVDDESIVVIELEAAEVREGEVDRVRAYRHRHEIYWAATVKESQATELVELLAREHEGRIFE